MREKLKSIPHDEKGNKIRTICTTYYESFVKDVQYLMYSHPAKRRSYFVKILEKLQSCIEFAKFETEVTTITRQLDQERDETSSSDEEEEEKKDPARNTNNNTGPSSESAK